MPEYWHKGAYLASELDPLTGEPLYGVLPPGLYCEDQAGYDALLSAPDLERTAGALVMGSMALRIATPEQAAVLRLMPTMSPAEHRAREQAAFDAMSAKVSGLIEKLGGQAEKPRARPTVPAPYRLPKGLNRAARRASAARGRRA